MSLTLANTLSVDEDQTGSSAGEASAASAGAHFYDTALGTALTAYDADRVAPTADFTTKQVAVSNNVFSFGSLTSDLTFSTTSSGLTAFGTTTGSGVASGLYLADGTTQIYLFQGTDNDIIVGRIANDVTADVAFTIALDEEKDVGTGFITNVQVWVTQYAALSHSVGSGVVNTSLDSLLNKLFVSATEATENTASQFEDVKGGLHDYAMLADDTNSTGPTSIQVLTTGYLLPTGDPATVNISTSGIGVAKSQSVNRGEGVRLDTVYNGDTTADLSTIDTIDFDSHAEVNNFGFTLTQVQGAPIFVVRAFDTIGNAESVDVGSHYLDDLGSVNAITIQNLRITSGAGVILYENGANTTAGNTAGLAVTAAVGGGFQIAGAQALAHVQIVNNLNNLFDRVTVDNITGGSSNDTFDIGHLTYTAPPTVSTTSAEFGSAIQILDDTPTITIAADTAKTVVLDETAAGSTSATIDTGVYTKGEDPDVAGTGVISSNSTSGSVFSVLTSSFGSDGPAAVNPTTSALTVTNAASGLKVTDGSDINLVKLANGNVVGVVQGGGFDGKAAFAISIDSSGVVTVEQYLSLQHPTHATAGNSFTSYDETVSLSPGHLGVTVTLTDHDGDAVTSTAADISAQILFHDDGPSAALAGGGTVPTLTVDDSTLGTDATGVAITGLFTTAYGADGPGTTAYTLNVAANADSGLVDTQSGNHVFLFKVGATVVGKAGVDAAAAATGAVVFVVSVDAGTGALSLDQQRAVIHTPETGVDQTTTLTGSNKITLIATVTDQDGDQAVATADLTQHLVFKDDAPTANNDTDAVSAGIGGTAGGNVVTGSGTTEGTGNADLKGADGAVVAGVAAGDTHANLDSSGTVNTLIDGTYGKLSIAADGTYSYTRNPNTAGGVTDTFTYTLKDGDGDLSHATLILSIGDGTPTRTVPAAGGATTTVYEHGLPVRSGEQAGSGEIADGVGTDNDDTSEAVSGTIGFTSTDGISSVTLGGVALTGAAGQVITNTTAERLVVDSYSYDTATGIGSIAYTYTLKDNTSGDATTSTAFALVVADKDDNVAPAANLVINIVDDAPTANNDTDGVSAGIGGTAGGNVVTGVSTTEGSGNADVQGADGAVVVGVAAGDTHANLDSSGTVNTLINGTYGKLSIAADGTYTYTRNPNTAGGVTDTFTYTIKDGDGDLSHATLILSIGDGTPTRTVPAAGGATTTVYEHGLPVRAGETAGSGEIADGDGTDNDDTTEAVSGTIGFTSVDGLGSLSLGGVTLTGVAGQVITNTTAEKLVVDSYSYDTATGVGSIAYTYTLKDNTSGDATTSTSFALVVADKDDNVAPAANLVINIVDDTPTAHLDTGAVSEGALLTVIAANGVLTNDIPGADGFKVGGGVVGVATGSNIAVPVAGNVGSSIETSLGFLTLNANGSYTYQSKANSIADNAVDHFVYTMQDGDGDQSTITLDINITAAGPSATNDDQVLVYEKALDLNQDGADLVAGTVTGTLGSTSTLETDDSNTLTDNVSQGAGTLHYTLISSATGTYGTIHVNDDGSYVYTLSNTLVGVQANDGAQTEQNRDNFTYRVTDANGNYSEAIIHVDIVDDVPTVSIVADATKTVSLDETAAGSVAALINTDTYVKGEDLDVTGTGAISVVSSSGSVVTLTSNFGADGAAISGATTYALSVTAAASGLKLTDGADISLVKLANGNVVGVVQGAGTFAGKAAFAIAINSSGVVTVEQYLSLQHPDAAISPTFSSYDETVALLANTLGVVVTLKDGDGDVVASNTADISGQISFHDDGPTTTNDGQLASVDDNAVAVVIGTVAGITGNDSYGADGKALTDALTFATGDHGGTIAISAGGDLLYTSHTNIVGPSFTAVTETFTYTIKDGDGDTRTATFTVQITDQGPVIATAAATICVDEEGLTGGNAGQQSPITGDLTGIAKTASGTLAGLGFGVDGPGNIALAAVADTGLRTLTDHIVKTTWDNASHTLTGADAVTDAIVFTLQITNVGTGAYTFTLSSPVKHATAGQEDDATLNIGVTVTDHENEAATNGVISILIDDDSPTATMAAATTPPSVVLDESDAANIAALIDTGAYLKGDDVDVTGTGAISVHASSGAVAALTSSYGADGAAATTPTIYALNVTNALSGLKVTDGSDISLVRLTNGNVVGVVGAGGAFAGKAAFAISIDAATGIVTVEQYLSLKQLSPATAGNGYNSYDEIAALMAGSLGVTATVTDRDGDFVTTNTVDISAQIQFHDDGPTLTARAVTAGVLVMDDDFIGTSAATATYDFQANVFNAAAMGADGGSAQLIYKLGVKSAGADTGLLEAATNQHIYLELDGAGGVRGYFIGPASAHIPVFSLSVAADGKVSVTQFLAIEHPGTDNALSIAADLITLTGCVTDGDGDVKALTLNIGQTLSFGDAQPVFVDLTPMTGTKNTVTGTGAVLYATGAHHTDNFSVNFHNDVPGSHVTISAYDAFTSEGLIAVLTGNRIDYVKSLQPVQSSTIYHVVVTDTAYTVTVDNAPSGLLQRIAFEKIPSGSPTETVRPNLTGDYGGSVTIDGLIFDSRNGNAFSEAGPLNLNSKLNGAASDADDINTNNIGFGIKGGQASQINPYEGFKVSYNAPNPNVNGGLDHLTHLSFDIYGIGNIPNVTVQYWLYSAGTDGIQGNDDDKLVDSNRELVADLFKTPGAHNIDLFDHGSGSGLGTHTVTFDYVVVNFEFPADKKGIIDVNQGIRIGTFFTTIVHSPEGDSFNFTMSATDADGDTANALIAVGVHPTDGWTT